MRIYVVRHGKTDWNALRMIQGRTDIELNEDGINQAKELKNKFKNISFDVCYSSPLKRAYDTAKIIYDGEVIKLDNLIERCFGSLEGTNMPIINFISKHWDYKLNTNEYGVEPIRDLLSRLDLVKEFILNKNYENVLIVSHGAALKALHYAIIGYDENTDFLDYMVGNCEVTVYEIINNKLVSYKKI